MKKRKNTEFYLLRKKSLSEADLFVTDYIKTKQRLENLESEFVTLQTFVRNQEIYFNDKKIAGVVLVNPYYQGYSTKIEPLIEICHKNNLQ